MHLIARAYFTNSSDFAGAPQGTNDAAARAGREPRTLRRRLTVLLGRKEWKVNAKRIYRLYMEDGIL